LNFLEHFEGLDKFDGSGTPLTDDITPVTPSTLGVPPPPLPMPPPGPPPPNWSKVHEIAFIVNVCLAQFITLGALAQTVAPLSIIADDLKVESPGQMSWFTAAYSMTLGTFILPAGMRNPFIVN